MKLYDMQKNPNEWRKIKGLKLQTNWRSKQVYQCKVCGSRTNRWHIGGIYGSGGARIICSHYSEPKHDNIERVMNDLAKLKKKIAKQKSLMDKFGRKANSKDRKSLAAVLDALNSQKFFLEKDLADKRKRFNGKDDVVGVKIPKGKLPQIYFPNIMLEDEDE